MTDYPLTDSEFMDIDDKLQDIVQKTFSIKYNLNEDDKLFDWYCKIRNNLCQQIHNKKKRIRKNDK